MEKQLTNSEDNEIRYSITRKHNLSKSIQLSIIIINQLLMEF